MEKEMTYYDWLFNESKEEKEIKGLLDEERARFENTEVYREHYAKVDELLERLKDEGRKRREEAKKHKPRRRRIEPMSEEEMADFRERNRKEKEARIDALPEPLRSLIRGYEALPEDARKVFQKETWAYAPDYGQYENPITTEGDIRELLEILVQTTIDFINERGLTDIDSVGFSADGLQGSARLGDWAPCTDASIHVSGIGKVRGGDGQEYSVAQRIGEYM